MPLQHPVPGEHLKHFGDITVSFALLESCVKNLAESLLGTSQRVGQIVTAELSFKALRDLTISLYLERNGEDDDFAQLRLLTQRLKEIEEKRNQMTHSLWAVGDDTGSITRIKASARERHGLQFRFEQIKSEDLASLAEDIKKLGEEIQVYWISLIKQGKATNAV
jgi:hypothetical protein